MRKRPTDLFQLAKLIGDIATGQVEDKADLPKPKKDKKSPSKQTKKK